MSEGCRPCSPVLCGSRRRSLLGSVATGHRVVPQTAFLKGHGQSLSSVLKEEVIRSCIGQGEGVPQGPVTPRVSRRRVRFRSCASASDSTLGPQVGHHRPGVGFQPPPPPTQGGRGEDEADMQRAGLWAGSAPANTASSSPSRTGPGGLSQPSVSLRVHLARTFSRAPKGHAAPAQANGVVSPRIPRVGRWRSPETLWVMGTRPGGDTEGSSPRAFVFSSSCGPVIHGIYFLAHSFIHSFALTFSEHRVLLPCSPNC